MAFRWLALAVFAGALSVSAYHRRRARECETIPRRREGGAMMAARALVAFPLFISPLAYVAHPPVMAWASFEAPGWLRWAGVGLGVVVIASVHWVLSNLGRNVSETVLTKESHELVTSGPYRWIRHPLYTTGIALFVALGLIAANWFILLCAAAALVGIRLAVIPREERALRARFGAAYDDLVSRTGAMWPRAGASREK
ncbi:MAG TPA: isoprenylcysteine carboxylmethyltransferase family protein [Vicinamibacterales bacterium]|jgi:protein-S-isoprenylcysteine O-methyltransferase Ste14|nr:isoprenylcysteine carboxylmethyltransferase family protein [Vicinamibacterales bacterium]